jgi:hypothetical protein
MEDRDLLLDDDMDAELGNLGEGLMTNTGEEEDNLNGDWDNMAGGDHENIDD